MEERVPMTVRGKKKLDEELKNLMYVERPRVVAAIEVARAHGDLSENADYSAAKERQSFIEGRIQEINAKMIRAQVIEPTSVRSSKIVFGATVTLDDIGGGQEVTYQIVGVDEADIKEGKIGITSPMARALIGKAEGDEITVKAPKGDVQYQVVEIRYE